MGMRYRRSINLGGGFRINISSTGIGYSWGGRGYRVTRTARGTTRRTISIPGTGISYVSETRQNQSRNSSGTQQNGNNSNTYDTREIRNAAANELASEGLEDMIAAAAKALKLQKISFICFAVFLIMGCMAPPLFVLAFLSLVALIFVRVRGVIQLDYSYEDNQGAAIAERMEPFHKIVQSARMWYLTQRSRVSDRKYTGGASHQVRRTRCTAGAKLPFPFKSNTDALTFSMGKEKLIFLPDKLFVIQGTKIGAQNYSDIRMSVEPYNFIEDEAVPKDAQVVGRTWKYVNRNGGPDKRFKNNRQLPICRYGKMTLKSSSGLNTEIVFSKLEGQIRM